MSVAVFAPCAGTARPIDECVDDVFARQILGPGVVIDPDPGPSVACAPLAGTIVKLHPHAFVMVDDAGNGILVHLGINTVRLRGAGFEVLAAEGDRVEAGDPVITWDPHALSTPEISPQVPVVWMDPSGSVVESVTASGAVRVSAGQLLFRG